MSRENLIPRGRGSGHLDREPEVAVGFAGTLDHVAGSRGGIRRGLEAIGDDLFTELSLCLEARRIADAVPAHGPVSLRQNVQSSSWREVYRLIREERLRLVRILVDTNVEDGAAICH